MDESQALDALANFMNDLAENPFDIPTHLQHIRLAESFPGMEAEAMSAREMMSQFLAVGEDIWLPLLDAKESSLDLETEEGVSELLALYERAEADYLCKETFILVIFINSKLIQLFQFSRNISNLSSNDTPTMLRATMRNPKILRKCSQLIGLAKR